MKKTTIITLVIILCSTVCNAQRMYNGQSALQLTISSVDGAFSQNTLSWAVSLQYDRDTQNGRLLAAAEYAGLRSKYADPYLPYSQITAGGGYAWRIWSTYNKKVALHGGGLVLFGHEDVNISSLPDGMYTSCDSRMIYGIAPSISLDMLISRDIALTLQVKENITLNSDMTNNHTIAGIGVKYLIN